MKRWMQMIVALVALVACVMLTPVGAQVALWVSTATGLTTSGTVAITNSGGSALSVTGTATAGAFSGSGTALTGVTQNASAETISGAWSFSNALQVAVGSAGTPGVNFGPGDTSTGVFQDGLAILGLSAGGLRTLRVRPGSVEVNESSASPDTAQYGIFGVTRSNSGGNLSYIALTKAGTAAFGFGINSANQLIIGPASNPLTITPQVQIGGGNLTVTGNGANIVLDHDAAAADNRRWFWQSLGTSGYIAAINDALNASSKVIEFMRSGTQVTSINYGPSSGLTSGHTFQGGRINTNTAQPGFLCFNGSSDVVGDTAPGGVVVDCDTEVYDEVGNFSADTFAAPAAGRYHLCGRVSLSVIGTTASVVIETSNRSYRILNTGDASAEDGDCVYADMDAGDTAVLRAVTNTAGDTIAGSGSPYVTYFSGRLVP